MGTTATTTTSTATTYATEHRVADPNAYPIRDMLTMLEATVYIADDGTVHVTISNSEIRNALAEMQKG